MWSHGLGDVETLLRTALLEDLAAGDITSQVTVPADARARAGIIAKAPLVLAGVHVAARAFTLVDPTIAFTAKVADGTAVVPGTRVAELEGPARSVLAGERTALNLLQRLSGVATLTRVFVDAARGRCRIVDTRKTTPGLRTLQRYAVRCGGGHNHRNDLGAAVLIKENHIRCAGGIIAAITAARRQAPHTMAIECEVTNQAEVAEALAAGADIIMLDNMDDRAVASAVSLIDRRAQVEVSGSVGVGRVQALAELGVDIISIGALTHSAPAADLSLLVDLEFAS